jgi:hypothetical protein
MISHEDRTDGGVWMRIPEEVSRCTRILLSSIDIETELSFKGH